MDIQPKKTPTMNPLLTSRIVANFRAQTGSLEPEIWHQGLSDRAQIDINSMLPDHQQIVNPNNDVVDYKRSNSINLSPREQAIAQLVAQGLPNKVIAKQLEISPWTVASHLRRIFIKIGVSSRTAMIVKLLDRHLL